MVILVPEGEFDGGSFSGAEFEVPGAKSEFPGAEFDFGGDSAMVCGCFFLKENRDQAVVVKLEAQLVISPYGKERSGQQDAVGSSGWSKQMRVVMEIASKKPHSTQKMGRK
ncbi:uncharacterized protein LOC123908012 isoform X8 [Trifolium pratense]|nr:uncharacterized protein LOC123908012 isoform X8 [Trifolium pratense]